MCNEINLRIMLYIHMRVYVTVHIFLFLLTLRSFLLKRRVENDI